MTPNEVLALCREKDVKVVDFVETPKKPHQDVTRAFATVALGFLGDKDDIPLLSYLQRNSNFLAQTAALAEMLTIL